MQCPANTLSSYVATSQDDLPTISLANRYLTSATNGENYDFTPNVDPKGILAQIKLETNTLRYTTDNVVNYYELKVGDEDADFLR